MRNTLREELIKLSAAERLELVEELWDSIGDEDEALALSDEQRADLERRLAEADADPTGGTAMRTVENRCETGTVMRPSSRAARDVVPRARRGERGR